ncbi:MAG: M14 family metallocarboxypeptidase [Candidatus Nitrohelix vancouverensis]|uniref:M14 family metallocarboxypeptidase n=1 Tax=Candidatus Nitrohelix vancouverensis TaxID=2705534 RepID=A0A7T0C3Q4_9BACT|nr:MAG: M14 family metallocarboxypeptidase [Candidatus Nitrohelix vancouverensis]
MIESYYSKIVQRLEAWSAHSDTPILEIGRSPAGDALMRIDKGVQRPHRALISAGIHGDEPGGVEAVCAMLENNLLDDFLNDWEFVILPCINPDGLNRGTRNNSMDQDLNRLFNTYPPPEEVKCVQDIFERPFDLTLELHEDTESNGYYLYQKIRRHDCERFGGLILRDVQLITPLNLSNEIDGHVAEGGMIEVSKQPVQLEFWPMAFYAYHKGANACLTLETPGGEALERRVEAHCAAVPSALRHYQELFV